MRHLITLVLALNLLSSAVYAQGVATFSYQRGVFTIARAAPIPAENLPWQAEGASPEISPNVDISVDIRPGASLYRQDGWISMGSLSNRNGMVFIFERPQIAEIGRLDYYQPLDIIWVDANGIITTIAPNLVLAGVSESLQDGKPSKAIVLLAGGEAEKNGLNPGDRVIGSEYFVPPPSIITLPK